MLLTILAFYYAQILQGNVSPLIVKDYITTEALIVGVDPQIALKTAKIESGYDKNQIGDKGTSYGIWQIHLPAHPDVSKSQAQDIIFSTEWAMNEMKKDGGCKIWSSCTQVMKSQDSS